MKKIWVILVLLVFILGAETAMAGVKKVVSESLELTIYDNDGVLVSSGEENGAAIEFNLDNIKPGETRTIDWTARNIGKTKGVIDYLKIKAIQDGGIHMPPEMTVDPDNSGDLGALLICTLSYSGQDYILPMDEVLSTEGIIYNPGIVLESGQSTDFKLTMYWPDHRDDNLGQGDILETKIDIRMTQVE